MGCSRQRLLHHLLAPLVGLGLLWPAGCAADPPNAPDEKPPMTKHDVASLAGKNTRFALDLYDRLRAREGNLFCSPYSISTALAMTYAGARDETATEMAETLHFTLPQDELHATFAALAEQLTPADSDETAHVELAIANRLWGGGGERFLDSFLDTTRKYYGGGFETVDFGAPVDAAKTINTWVEEQTRERIKDLVKPDDVAGASIVLTNAIYFKGDWAVQFDPEETRDAAFHISSKKSTTVPMMQQEDKFRLYESDELQVLEMPYEGERLSMVVLLPRDRAGLPALEESLTAQDLNRWIDRLALRKVEVFLPKFTMTIRFELAKTLAEMGMPRAFTPRADFSGMDGTGGIFLSKVIHQAFVEVNEEGTEAAAATAVIGIRSAAPSPTPVFRADHPFMFLIRDRETGSILFLGRVTDPGESAK